MIPSLVSPLFSSLHKIYFKPSTRINRAITSTFHNAFSGFGLQKFNDQDIFIYRDHADEDSSEALVIATGSGKKPIDDDLSHFITTTLIPKLKLIPQKAYTFAAHEIGETQKPVGGFAKGTWNKQKAVVVVKDYNHDGPNVYLHSPTTGELLEFKSSPQSLYAYGTLNEKGLTQRPILHTLPAATSIRRLAKIALES